MQCSKLSATCLFPRFHSWYIVRGLWCRVWGCDTIGRCTVLRRRIVILYFISYCLDCRNRFILNLQSSCVLPVCILCNTLQRTMQHTATHCNALQRTAAHCNTLQHTATHCIALQHTATLCNTLQRTAHSATHCTTLHHTTDCRNRGSCPCRVYSKSIQICKFVRNFCKLL